MSKRKKSNRKIHTRDLRERILIVCEGGKTEPNYFRKFPIDENKCYVKPMGVGYNTYSLVRRAIEIGQTSLLPFDQIWCVFDRDNFPAQNFNNAFEIAEHNNINIAYSNEAFELWYLLHFHRYINAMSRDQYQEKLTELLGHKYVKNSENIYDELIDRQPIAIENAKALLILHSENSDSGRNDPAKDNPSTTVHKLVEELNKRLLRHK
ncbi:RloB family protein [Dolichospermum sp. ST_sed10]|nr:RloB family protein [Dolichospermum sp. ST_sed10]